MEHELQPVVKTVCGGMLIEPEKYPSAEYQGRRVYFCTPACLRAFEKAPDAFVSGEMEHPVEAD